MSKIITIAQQKGGTGKTTIASQIAIGFSYIYKKVIIVDIDPQASLSKWYEIRKQQFDEKDLKIDFMQLSGWKASSELNQLKKSYDLIIVDSPPHNDTDTKTVIRSADLVIAPMQASPTDLWATKNIIEFTSKENKKIVIILNRFVEHNKLNKNIIDMLPKTITTLKLKQRAAYGQAMLFGKSVIEFDKKSDAANEITILTKELNKLLK